VADILFARYLNTADDLWVKVAAILAAADRIMIDEHCPAK
jgi:hypothetical protein